MGSELDRDVRAAPAMKTSVAFRSFRPSLPDHNNVVVTVANLDD